MNDCPFCEWSDEREDFIPCEDCAQVVYLVERQFGGGAGWLIHSAHDSREDAEAVAAVTSGNRVRIRTTTY